uniref:Bifunctional inhibitor/plant lipid transfer protein/seed storage helical domain-containing protein n=1 Tax=Brassica oleracea TaxID=3712 RepID=A0A3P6GH33_BRAOL|nr:unnamed protein product [Brassica oleracea]
MQATQPPSGPRALEFEDDIENPQGPQLKVTLFQQCCNELRQEDTICVCPALKHVSEEVRIQFEQEQHQGLPQIVSRIYQTAKQLPKFCKILNQTLWSVYITAMSVVVHECYHYTVIACVL